MQVTIKNDDMATRKLVEYVITVKKTNTDDWMQGLIKHLNTWTAAVHEEDRIVSFRDGLQVITPQDIDETMLPPT